MVSNDSTDPIEIIQGIISTLDDISIQAENDPGVASSRADRIEKKIERTLKSIAGAEEAESFRDRPLISYQMDDFVGNVKRQIEDMRDYLLAAFEDGLFEDSPEKGERPFYTTTQTMVSKVVVAANPRKVFMVFGRNWPAKIAMQEFLEKSGLDPYDLVQIDRERGEGTSLVRDLLEEAFRQSHAVIVLLTPDDDSRLREEWVDDTDRSERLDFVMPQPRMNVLFEVGIAWGLKRSRKTLLVQMYKPERDIPLRLPSDIQGHLVARIIPGGDVVGELKKIVEKLKSLKCPAELPDEVELRGYAQRLEEAISNQTPVESPISWTGRTVLGRRQGLSFLPIDMKGQTLKFAGFRVICDNGYWRAGILLESKDSLFTAPDIKHKGSVLFHVGLTDGLYGAYIYQEAEGEEPPTDEKLGLPYSDGMVLQVHLNPGNVLECRTNGYDKSLPLKDLDVDRMFLVAWADSEKSGVLRDFKVEFVDIEIAYK